MDHRPLLRRVAIRSPDPTSWACISTEAHATINQDADFELEWFLRWQPVLLPHRPWQYAVLTWRRMQGAEPCRVVQFMLRVLHAKQQQVADLGPQQKQRQAQQGQLQQQPANQQQQAGQQQQQQAQPISLAELRHYKGRWTGTEGCFKGRLPDLQPLPSTLRAVQQLLAKSDLRAHLRALLLLCPCSTPVLAQYAGRHSASSCSALGVLPRRQLLHRGPLLQLLAAGGLDSGISGTDQIFSSAWHRLVPVYRLGCYAALAAGQPALLLLQALDRSSRVKRALLPLLLRYTVRYSNSACLEALLLIMMHWRYESPLAPQHLAMAADRTDPWAPGIITLLMELLSPKQLKPTNLRPAYKAAAVTGHLPVLALLLRHAATQPARHLPVLLQAVADSGNRTMAELLLGDIAAVLSQLQQQQAEQEPWQQLSSQEQQEMVQHIQQLLAAWPALTPKQVYELLHAVLPVKSHVRPSLLAKADLAAESLRSRMADRLLRLLPPERREELQAGYGVRRRVQGLHRTQKLRLWKEAEAERNKSQPARRAWQLRHGISPGVTTRTMLQRAADLGQHRDAVLQSGEQSRRGLAARLHRQAAVYQRMANRCGIGASAATETGVKPPAAAVDTAMSVMEGRLSAACAACDAAAVAQLEQLYMLCYMLLTPPPFSAGKLSAKPATTAAVAPTLPVSLAGGKVVTVAHLSAGLGLPWGLLGTLLAAAGYDQLAPGLAGESASASASSSAAAGASSCSSGGASSIQQQVADAMQAVQDPAAALEAGVLRASSKPHADCIAMATRQRVAHMAYSMHAAATRQYLLRPQAGAGHPDIPEDRLYTMFKEQDGLQQQLQAAFDHDLQQLTTQQEQQGPPPLWQQALLQLVAQQAPLLRSSSGTAAMPPPPGQAFPRWAGLPAPQLAKQARLLLHGLQAGRSAQQVQEFVNKRLLQQRHQQGPPAVFFPGWGSHILEEALLHRAPQLLNWALHEDQYGWLFGGVVPGLNERLLPVLVLHNAGLNQATCRAVEPSLQEQLGFSSSMQQVWQQRDAMELQQQRAQLIRPFGFGVVGSSSCGPMVCAAGPLPQFAASAVQLALALLQQPDAHADTLDRWLRHGVGVTSTLPDLVRARAIVAAVAEMPVIPPGAQVLHREAVRQVLLVGDPDLWTVVLLWSHRLPMAPEGAELMGDFVDGDVDGLDQLLGDAVEQGVAGIADDLAAGVGAVAI